MDSSNTSDPCSVSIVIPARDESTNLRRLLPELLELVPRPEIVVSESASRDDTAEVAWNHGARLVQSSPGRGPQLNTGAQSASGDVLVFLHADSILVQESWTAMHDALRDASLEGGSFTFSLAGTGGIWPRVYEFFVGLRTHWLCLPYGDQGFFVRRTTWERVGPFRDEPLMEDVEWWKRFCRTSKAVILDAPLVTSARRFQKRGWLLSAVRNILLLTAFRCGVAPSRLVRWYR